MRGKAIARLWALLICLLVGAITTSATGAYARDLSAAVIDEAVLVTSNFAGAKVTIFGAVPAHRAGQDIIVVIRGPDRPAWISERQRVAGLWIGRSRTNFQAAPTYFGVATTRPLGQIARPDTLALYGLTPESQVSLSNQDRRAPNADAMTKAFVQARRAQGLYVSDASALKRLPGGLFRADLNMPDTTAPGLYTAKVLIFNNGRQIESTLMSFVVSKVGLERALYRFSTKHAGLYALLGVLIALSTGYIAQRLLRRVSIV